MEKEFILPAVFVAFLGVAFSSGVAYIGYEHFTEASEIEGDVDVEIDMVADDWYFDPEEITVEKGDHVRLVIDSRNSETGTYDHGIHIPSLGVSKDLEAGKTHEVEFVADEVGEHRFYCNVYCGDGHHNMDGTVIVEENGETDFDEPDTSQHDQDGSEEDYDTDEDIPTRSPEDAEEELSYEKDEDGVKEFNLTAEHIMWDYGTDHQGQEHIVESWGYNGQLPGPEIRVQEGDEVRVNFQNNAPINTTVHWHGVDVPIEADGVPGVTQEPVQQGENFTYEFTAKPAGTRFYHTHGSDHTDEQEQMDMGLAGPLIIEPEEFEEPDVDYTMVLSERIDHGIYPIQGQIYPEVPEIKVEEGDKVRVRMINAGSTTFHPMHLHGHQFEVIAKDGNPVPENSTQERNVKTVHPGETIDIEFEADNPGQWMFHCHELAHAAGGMIAEVVYEGYESDYSDSEHSH